MVTLLQIQGNCEVQDGILLLLPAGCLGNVHGEDRRGGRDSQFNNIFCTTTKVGIKDPKVHAAAKSILLEMGEFFQIQVTHTSYFRLPARTNIIFVPTG